MSNSHNRLHVGTRKAGAYDAPSTVFRPMRANAGITVTTHSTHPHNMNFRGPILSAIIPKGGKSIVDNTIIAVFTEKASGNGGSASVAS